MYDQSVLEEIQALGEAIAAANAAGQDRLTVEQVDLALGVEHPLVISPREPD